MIKLPLSKDIPYYFTEKSFSTKVLYPEEQYHAKGYETRRLNEFCTGRYCAHKCLEDLEKNAPIIKQETGAPKWPQHVVGSISHSPKLTGAIVASTEQYSSIGLDIESIGRINHSLWEMLFTSDEINLLKQQPKRNQEYLSTLFFSLKEAFYKMQFPFTKTFLDFHDCEVVKTNGDYNVVSLKDDLVVTNKLINYQSQYVTYDNQIITYVIAK